jgi:hypothetical protein
MKKYKLQEIYPGSPEKDTIGWLNGTTACFKEPSGKEYFQSSANGETSKTFDYKQWEEIIEKDYEILSYYQNSNLQRKNIYYKSHRNWEYIEKLNYKIHSVKRLSDGEVFTVNDRVNYMGDRYTISRFEKLNEIFLVGIVGMQCLLNLIDIEPIKTPLFKTKDGVDIFEGDYYYWVDLDKGENYLNISDKVKAHEGTKLPKSSPAFSTKKAAKSYIEFKIPLFITEDGVDVFKGDNIGNTAIRREQIENHPEYWQKVVERDYEILSFIRMGSSYKGSIKTKDSDGYFKWDFVSGNDTEERLLTCDGFKIHSVKRLSDGAVFTVGDYINYHCSKSSCKKQITSIKIIRNVVKIITGDGCEALLWMIHHYKNPLFKTEDGVDIFEGDEVWGITKDSWKPFYTIAKNKPDNVAIHETWLHGKFSTKKAAKEYIFLNEPKLSINDVKRVFPLMESIKLDKLKFLVKEKRDK